MRAECLAACIWLATFLGGIAGELPVYFHEAEQDATGKVWAFSRDKTPSAYAFESGEWKQLPSPQKDARPVSLAKLNDGAVACVWRIANNHAIITRHLGSQTRPFARGLLPIPKEDRNIQPPFVDSHNRLWFTDTAPEIYRAGPDGTIKLVHRLVEDEIYLPEKTGSRSAWKSYNPIRAVEDGQGRIWLWSQGVINSLTIKGALVMDNGTATLKSIPGFENRLIRLIARKDAKTFWVAFSKEGLFLFDLESATLTPVPEPVPGAFRFVHQITAIDNDWYVAAAHPGDARYHGRTAFWRLRDGQWHNRTPDPSECLDYRVRDHLHWLKVKGGLIMMAEHNAPLFIPEKGKAALLNWRNDFPLNSPRHLIQLPDGNFLGRDGYRGVLHQKITLPPRSNPSPRIKEVIEIRDWVYDTENQPWWTSDVAPKTLHHFSKGKIETFPYPESPQPLVNARLVHDARGRLWIFTRKMDEPVLVFDTMARTWSHYPDQQSAFLSYQDAPPIFGSDYTSLSLPAYSSDGRQIAVLANSTIQHYDGKQWNAITKAMMGTPSVGVPFFDSDDRLCATINSYVWQFDGGASWKNLGKEKQGPEPESDFHPKLPNERALGMFESSALDNAGTYWFSNDRALYKVRPDLPPIAVFEPGEFHPFKKQHPIRRIRVDAEGNAFIDPDGGNRTKYILKAKGKLPTTKIEIETKMGVPIRAKLSGKNSAYLQWRLNDDAWQIYNGKPLTFESLPGGQHTLQAYALNSELHPEHPPVSATFTIEAKAGDAAPQPTAPPINTPPIPPLIADLHHPDYAKRNAAIATLAQYPEAALPALKEARATEEGDRRWWIDAAIQEIEK